MVTRMTAIHFRAGRPSGVSAKYNQFTITKPLPQKGSTMLESFNTRLINHSRVISPNTSRPPTRYTSRNVMLVLLP
jgi:hypothetical protein